jgi:uncharacterized protein YndB with AHSA1/START domain
MTTSPLPHRLERSVLIQAEPPAVFAFFQDSQRWASWWGAGSTIDPRVDGKVLIRLPGGVEITGQVIAIEPPSRLTFSYLYANRPPSRVTIRLEPAPGGSTRLHLAHEFEEAGMRDEHVQGWRYQLAVFANVVADQYVETAIERVDGWFAAWSEPDAAARDAALDRVASPGVRFRDRFSLVDGLEDLRPHLAAVHRFMPGMRLTRDGGVRHCQGTVLADWIARGTDGQERGRGTYVFVLGEGQRIAEVTGFWGG